MIQSAYRDPRLSRLRWLALIGLGALASIGTFFPFARTVGDPGPAGPVAVPSLFFGSVAILALAVTGYARARRREDRARERAADGADG